MRTKFRAYLKDSALLGLNEYYFEALGRIWDVTWIDFESKELCINTPSELTFKFKDVDLLQFTGLFDRNGVEIYEGDIVRSIYNATHINPSSKVQEKLMVVEYDDCNPLFVLVGITNKDDRQYDFIVCGLRINEVIGNLYEHKHLLEDKE